MELRLYQRGKQAAKNAAFWGVGKKEKEKKTSGAKKFYFARGEDR